MFSLQCCWTNFQWSQWSWEWSITEIQLKNCSRVTSEHAKRVQRWLLCTILHDTPAGIIYSSWGGNDAINVGSEEEMICPEGKELSNYLFEGQMWQNQIKSSSQQPTGNRNYRSTFETSIFKEKTTTLKRPHHHSHLNLQRQDNDKCRFNFKRTWNNNDFNHD